MKTSAISFRVADFLKAYPPFSYLDEAARERIAASGRVRFHEQGETLYSEGENRDHFLRVIQQGMVQLSRKSATGSNTVDLRGEGEILGLGSYLGKPTFGATATTVEETIIYALDAKLFAKEVGQCRQAANFLSVYFSVVDDDVVGTEKGANDWFGELDTEFHRAHARLLTCDPQSEIREVARKMAAENSNNIVVVNEDGEPLGLVTNTDLRDRVATGEVPVTAPISALLGSPPPIAPPTWSVGRTLLRMMTHGTDHLCVTEDGTLSSRVVATVSERDVMLHYGNNPLVILREIRGTRDMSSLKALRDRMESLIVTGLRSPSDVDWYCQVAAVMQRAMIQRVIEFVCEKEGADAREIFGQVALTGSASRREMLTRTGFGTLLVLDEESAPQADRYAAILAAAQASWEELGFVQRGEAAAETTGTVAEWEERFRRWIAHPVESDIAQRIGYLDFEMLGGSGDGGTRLRQAIAHALKDHPHFIRLLANDCFATLPPVSIIRGYAVDADGLWVETLDIKRQALQPVADAARVLALDAGDLRTRSTVGRLLGATKLFPRDAEVFTGAAKAFRTALFQRALQGLRTGTEGSLIRPATLPRADHILLKASFGDIARLLEYVGKKYEVGS